tara:strand:- start:51 stop:236 length:186 start_codon:yes stop_codon:yes gene_type:complete
MTKVHTFIGIETLFVEYKSYTIRIEQSAETDGNLHIHVWDTENWKEDGDFIDRLFIEKGRI